MSATASDDPAVWPECPTPNVCKENAVCRWRGDCVTADPVAVKALNDYVDRKLTDALAEATRCPTCGPWLLCDDPIGPGVWCPICGYRRATA